MKSIRARIVSGYLLLVVIFAVSGGFAFWRMMEVNRATERFIDHYWHTADLIMDLRSQVNEVFITAMTLPQELDREKFLWQTRDMLVSYRNRLPQTVFDAAVVQRLQDRLLDLERVLPGIVRLASTPVERMEATDALADKLLAQAERIGDLALVEDLRRATMTFNDVLTSHDPQESENFAAFLSRIREEEKSGLPAADLAAFETAAQDVFAADRRLQQARQRFQDVRVDLQQLLQTVETHFEQEVVAPEETRVLELIGSALAILASFLLAGISAALLAGSLLARSLSRPLEKAIGMVKSLEAGELSRRLDLDREDEIGQMGRALNAFADTLQSTLMALLATIDVQRRTAAELKESEGKHRKLAQEFEVVLEGIPDSLALLGPDLRVLWANAGTAGQAGRELRELPGLACRNLVGEPVLEDQGCVVERCFASGRPEDGGVSLANGRILGVKAFPLLDRDGGVSRVIRLASDVTERHRLREEAVRTSRLAALGELSAGVAHEINNPNALTLYNVPVLIDCFREMLPILEEHRRRHGDFTLAGLSWDELQEEIPALLKEVLDGAGRIQRIVEDLKNFVRLEGTEGAMPFDLNEAVGTAVRLTTNALQRTTDHFVVDLEGNLPPCRGISQRIEQVIINLLQNAAQALPARRCRIRLATCYDAEAGMNLVTVEDEGWGIEKKHLSHITDPFFTTRRNSGGTGLGLSISARIVQEHHGRLEFASVPGRGTTVRLWLPTSNENQGDEA